MSKSFGGKQTKLRETRIMQEQGYLGKFPRSLQPDDTQRMVFYDDDDGPFWMTPAKCNEQRYDKIVEGKFTTKKLRKDEIIARLLDMQITAKGSLKDLQKIATDAGIVIEEIQPKIVEGWVGKAKGLLQVLWERGYIDNADGKAYHKYTMNGTKDVFGNNQPDTSLKLLMESCTDFEEEETMLQSMGREMNILVDRSPKCHCECAGEGIEY
jgi:hypothetical protein